MVVQGQNRSSDGRCAAVSPVTGGGPSPGAGQAATGQGAAVLRAQQQEKCRPRESQALLEGWARLPLWGPKDAHTAPQ